MENDNFGKIFFPKDATEDDRQYITYDGFPYYDWHAMINNKISQEGSNYVIKFPEGGGSNLVVKTCNSGDNESIYSCNVRHSINISSNTNFIIPSHITLTKDCKEQAINNINENIIFNIICLGNIVTNNEYALINNRCISSILFGPQSKLEQLKGNVAPIYTDREHPNYIFYPSNQIITDNIIDNY